jgi:phosphatidylglycerol:prolipoprotein diacylglycerol transferase
MAMVCDFSSVAFYFLGFPIHWYSLAYIFGILIALMLTKLFMEKAKRFSGDVNELSEDFVNYAIVGIIIGGRVGHVLFYDFDYYIANFSEIFKVWRGGMSFFGGFLGTLLTAYVFCRRRRIDFLGFMDFWAVSVPIGLFLGRSANFINGELLGKESYVAWNVVFMDGVHRHPSQLYEAFLEGFLLFGVMLLSFRMGSWKYNGRLSGIFCLGYGIARFIGEFFREPDSMFSYQLLFCTYLNFNQYLSIGIAVVGSVLICRSRMIKHA